MPPKPTCKVVKREGQRGARIDPKGCKVRTTKDAQGNKRQYNNYNKQGQEKFKITEIKDEHVTMANLAISNSARDLHRRSLLLNCWSTNARQAAIRRRLQSLRGLHGMTGWVHVRS